MQFSWRGSRMAHVTSALSCTMTRVYFVPLLGDASMLGDGPGNELTALPGPCTRIPVRPSIEY